MKWLSRFVTLFLLGFSVFIGQLSLKLGVGGPRNPGPGFMPLLASALLLILALVVVIMELRRSAEGEGKKPLFDMKHLIRPVSVFVVLFGFSFILNVFGFLVSIFLLFFVLFLIYEPKKWLMHIIVAVIVANASFLLFYKILQVQLPAGMFNIRW
ncbi:MAG: tripartite tricarboxylate transporter TctB family protein [Thermodesulfobacteriota bacterium]